MDYQDIKNRVNALIKGGGFPADEPLDSLRLIWDSPREEIPDYQIGFYSSVLAQVGQWDRAEAVARLIRNNEDEKGTALALLAQRLAAADLLDRAESVALSIPNSPKTSGAMAEKATALLAVASKCIGEGKRDSVERLLNEADRTIKQLSYANNLLVSLLGDLAQALYKVGDADRALKSWDEAMEVAGNSIRSYRAGGAPDVDSWKALAIIAQDLFAIGENGRAERALALIDNDQWRERARNRMHSTKEQ